MNREKLADLERATDAVFQKHHQALRPVLEAEARLQQQLSALDRQVTQVRSDSAETDGYRVTGTDILWNGWESATRRLLNTELARVRARKLDAMEQLKTAFGRKQAIEAVSGQLRQEHRIFQSRKLQDL